MLLFHLKNRFQVLKGMSVKVSRKQSKNWLRRTNRQVSLNAKSWSYIDTVVNNHEATSNCFHFYRTIVIFSTICFVGIFWNLARVFYQPWEAFDHFVLFCFFARKIESLKTQTSQKYKNTISAEKTKQDNKYVYILQRLGRGSWNTCAKLQGLTKDNGVDIGLWRNLVR